MTMLERIDRIKSDLQLAKESLHEADNWTVSFDLLVLIVILLLILFLHVLL